ncbi:hypothetical protein [Staphylococcus epidermidis]|uniref:hypothetical protein n=1 Tax=Staphylococcus epidermidis TaxID=1282 RepID=UPI002886F448|nr:hypothetical protein [Staphylococcus epidermidis]MDT0758504.1 hypothetical protein [Staphylococcus epidermidis]
MGTSLLLSACSSNGSSEANKEKVEFANVMSKGKQVTFRVDANEEETYAPNKDNPIDAYIFSDNGKVTVYNATDDTKLKDMKDKSYDDILELAKKQDKKRFENNKSDNEKDIENVLDTDKSNYEDSIRTRGKKSEITKDYKKMMETTQKKYEKYKNLKYEEPKQRDLKIGVVEDGSGNDTKEERFYTTPDGFDGQEDEFIHDPEKLNKDYKYVMRSSGEIVEIYDDKYAYLDTDQEGEDRSYLVTKVGDKAKESALDKPDNKNVKVEEDDDE